MTSGLASRGEVWLLDVSPARGHKKGGVRPALVVSTDPFNHGPAGLIVILPLTTRQRNIPLHILLEPPEGGVQQPSFAKPEDIRSVSISRLLRRWGTVSPASMAAVEDRLRIVLEL